MSNRPNRHRHHRRRYSDPADEIVYVGVPDMPALVDHIGDPATDEGEARVAAAVIVCLAEQRGEPIIGPRGERLTATQVVDAARELRAAGLIDRLR